MPAALSCHYFDAGVCRSCTFLDVPYAEQLARKQERAAALIDPFAVGGDGAGDHWLEPWANRPGGFRNRAKMVVGGRRGAPTLGILDAAGRGVDLRECPLHEPAIVEALPHVADLVAEAGIIPYDVPGRQGELKHVLTTASPDGELMMRFVLRSTDQLRRLERHLPRLLDALPHLRVVTANILPEHKAVLEGEREIHLAGDEALTMRVGGLPLRLRPQGFFQTCTAAAAAMYAQAAAWAKEGAAPWSSDVRPAWDLYCGVGGFALSLARGHSGEPGAAGRAVVGVETSADAVAAARTVAADLAAERPGPGATFHAADATAWVRTELARAARGEAPVPAVIVVNPPRRGIGAELAGLLEDAARIGRAGAAASNPSAPRLERIVYSSCNVESLAKDLARMPSWRAHRARVVDMFPHTAHMEVMVDLRVS